MIRWIRLWLWAKVQNTIWRTRASADQLDQIIWRLSLCESALPADAKRALALARQLRKRVRGASTEVKS